MENKATRVLVNRRFIFCKLQKMKRRLTEESAACWNLSGNSCLCFWWTGGSA